MVFQQFNLFPHKTVKENIMLAPVTLKLMTPEEAEKKAMELLTRVGLPDKADAYPGSLSGGQKQRICIARALLRKPKILILDDSTSAVDSETELRIRNNLNAWLRDTTVLIITQRIYTMQSANRVILLDDGEIESIGTPEELLERSEMYREIYYSQQIVI